VRTCFLKLHEAVVFLVWNWQRRSEMTSSWWAEVVTVYCVFMVRTISRQPHGLSFFFNWWRIVFTIQSASKPCQFDCDNIPLDYLPNQELFRKQTGTQFVVSLSAFQSSG